MKLALPPVGDELIAAEATRDLFEKSPEDEGAGETIDSCKHTRGCNARQDPAHVATMSDTRPTAPRTTLPQTFTMAPRALNRRRLDRAVVRVEEELGRGGASFERAPPEAAGCAWEAFRQAFLAPVKAATGEWVHLGYSWHAFTYGFVQGNSGARAEQRYRESWAASATRQGLEGWVLPCEDVRLAYRFRAAFPLMLDGNERYITPIDLRWAMFFTHEKGWMGPFFTPRT